VAGDQLEKQGRGIGLDRRIAQLVHDQQLRLAGVSKPRLKSAFAVCARASCATSAGADTNSVV
jgi:hypothetical protein